jgi:hypothetical protein
MRYLTDWLAGEKRGSDRLRSLVEPEEKFWTEDKWMDPEKPEDNKLEIETGICGNRITLRITSETGMVTTLTMDPDYARIIGGNIIGQANLVSPPDCAEPGPEPERNYVDPTKKPRREKGYG